jgi:hypothetical protein
MYRLWQEKIIEPCQEAHFAFFAIPEVSVHWAFAHTEADRRELQGHSTDQRPRYSHIRRDRPFAAVAAPDSRLRVDHACPDDVQPEVVGPTDARGESPQGDIEASIAAVGAASADAVAWALEDRSGTYDEKDGCRAVAFEIRIDLDSLKA